ncbi:MAG: oligosaccharide flippase family protein [Clostridiales bacterium]|nr:oligosaccharide flippase family protein [Clostridiales bacterium]
MRLVVNRLINKYKTMSLPAKAGLWFVLCNFMQRGITMITTPVFTRILPETEYGLVSTYLSWQSVLLLVTGLTLYKSLMNLYIRYDDKEKVLSSVNFLTLIITVIWLCIYLVFRQQISAIMKMSETLVLCLFIYFVAYSGIQCWQVYKRYTFDYKSLIFVTLITTGLSSVFAVIAVLFVSHTAEARLIPQTFITAIVGVIIYISTFNKGKLFYNKEIWSFSLIFCIALLPHHLSEFVLQSSDKLMINYMCGSHDVAIYSVAYSIGTLINLFTSAINNSFAPYEYQQIQAGNYEELSRTASKVITLVAVLLGLIMLFSEEIVWVFGGSKYLESTSIIVPICIGVFFSYLFQLFARVQEYFEHKATVVIPSILCAILNLILNYIFINIYGYKAAAYTTLFCYMFFCILHYVFYKRTSMKDLNGAHIYNGKAFFLISILVIICGSLIMLLNRHTIIKYIIIAIFAFVLAVFRKRIFDVVKKTIVLGKDK